MLTLPLTVRGARVSVSLTAIGALVVVVVAALVVFAVRVAQAQEAAQPVAVPVTSGSGVVVGRTVPSAFRSAQGSGTAPATPGAGSTAAGGAAAGNASVGNASASTAAGGRRVLVHVVGRVARPGVVSLPEGSRVVDAVGAAGGALPGADLAAVNLARVLVDGEQVVVPTPGQSVAAAPGGTVAGGSGASSGALVDLNSADAAALDGLPGVGPVLAQRILDWRAEHGRFTTVDELGEVSGIGEKLMEQLRPKVRVG